MMKFTDLYDKLSQCEIVSIMDANTCAIYYHGDLGRLPHSTFEKICLADIERVYVSEDEDFNSYLVVEVFVE